MVVRVEDESGWLPVVEVAPEVCFAVDEEDVLEGMMEATEGGKVVCPEVKTAHAPDKKVAPETASAESQLTLTQPVNPPTNAVLLVPQ